MIGIPPSILYQRHTNGGFRLVESAAQLRFERVRWIMQHVTLLEGALEPQLVVQ